MGQYELVTDNSYISFYATSSHIFYIDNSQFFLLEPFVHVHALPCTLFEKLLTSLCLLYAINLCNSFRKELHVIILSKTNFTLQAFHSFVSYRMKERFKI